jgi:hypothetical protein
VAAPVGVVAAFLLLVALAAEQPQTFTMATSAGAAGERERHSEPRIVAQLAD